MTVYVSMLRAVNVGGTSRIKMDALRAVYESIGLKDVRTLLQSGNVVFRSTLKDRERLVQSASRRSSSGNSSFRSEVIVRTLAELAEHRRARPRALAERRPEQAARHVPRPCVPDAAAQAALAQMAQEEPEMLEMRGPEIYLYYPDGVGRSKLSGAVIENKLIRRARRATGTR